MSRLCVIRTDETAVVQALAGLVKSMAKDVILDLNEEVGVTSFIHSDNLVNFLLFRIERDAFTVYRLREGAPTRIKLQMDEAEAAVTSIGSESVLEFSIHREAPDLLVLTERTEAESEFDPCVCRLSLQSIQEEPSSIRAIEPLCRYTIPAEVIGKLYTRLHKNRGELNTNSVVTFTCQETGVLIGIINRTNTRSAAYQTGYRDPQCTHAPDDQGQDPQVHLALSQVDLLRRAAKVADQVILEIGAAPSPMVAHFNISDVGTGALYLLPVRLNELLE